MILSNHIRLKSNFPGQQYLSNGAAVDPVEGKKAESNDPVHFNVFLYFGSPLEVSY